MKKCTRCLAEKPLSDFSPDRRISSGLQSRCKVCFAEMRRLAYADNPEPQKAAVKKYYAKHPERVRETLNKYRKNNADKVSLWKATDRDRHKARIHANNAARRAKIKTVNAGNTAIMYALRDLYCAMSLGERFHVDHIVPLAAGGTHSFDNLQVIPAIDNLRKGAKQ